MPKKSNNSADGNPRAASTRIGSATAKTLAGQIRHDHRRGPQPAYVDADRSHLNRVLIEPLPPGQMRAICEERRAVRDTRRAMKSNAAIATLGIITFGSEAAQLFEALTPDQQDAAFRELAQAVADRLATSLHGLVVHDDEATIHAHYELAAYNIHGEPVSTSTSPRVLSELQDIAADIMARHCPGIERGTRYGDRLAAGADHADVIHKSVAELHRTLPVDLAAKRGKLAELATAETEASARVAEMQARVDGLTEKASLSEREAKRLATYEKRLADRLRELEAAGAASEAAKNEADRLAALARADAKKQERSTQSAKAKVDALGVGLVALAHEVSSGTIRRVGDRVSAAHPEKMHAAFPEIRSAVEAAADLVGDMAAQRKKLEAERKALKDRELKLQSAEEEVSTLRRALQKALALVTGWLQRPDLTTDARADAVEIVDEIDRVEADPFARLLASKNSGEETEPGF